MMQQPKYAGVMVVGEQRDGTVHPVAFELLARGRQLADKLGVDLSCVLMGSRVESNAACLIERGADVVYVIDDPALSWFLPGLYSRALVRLIQDVRPEIVIAAATTTGRTLMPIAAARLGTGLTADCTELNLTGCHSWFHNDEKVLRIQFYYVVHALHGHDNATTHRHTTRRKACTCSPRCNWNHLGIC
jgi:electron transfer flavoprotein alpha subunit